MVSWLCWMARMMRMTPKRALFSVQAWLPARRMSQVTVTWSPPAGAVTEVTSPASPSSAWAAWRSCSAAVGGWAAVVDGGGTAVVG